MSISVPVSRPSIPTLAALALGWAFISPHSVCAQVFSGSLADAVQLTLHQEPSVSISRQQIAASQGQLLSARAPFDRLWNAGVSQQQSYTPIPASGGAALASRQLGYSAGVSQLLESGVVLNPTVSVNRIRDDAANSTAPSTSNVAFNVVIPLRKGAGRSVTTAPVTAAALSLEASRSSYLHTQAQAVARTVTAYWDVVAGHQSLDLALQAEARAGELLADARKLARADEIPNADLLKYEVRREAQESDRLRSALQLRQALQVLSQAMNTPIEALEAAPRGLDAFPRAEDAQLGLLDDPAAVARFLASGADRRNDIRAAEQRLRAANTLAEAARSNSATQLDLGLSVGYSGMTEGRAGAATLLALGQPARGANIGLTLNYTLPGGDFERRGLILQREAAAGQAQTDFEFLRLRVRGDMQTQLDALRAAIAQLDKANTQRRLQTAVYENEKRSYRAGFSTLLDLFTTESQLTAYQTGWVQAQRDFARALVLFRFQTASLLSFGLGGADRVEENLLQAGSLTTLPQEFFR
ncbi:TolC family protein [Polaromonas sp.]|uniref:TolC family protein n=1 Tax=Polaromonas sp. TaxID=1869339 RepID=UPI0018222FDA|nr:TolC family protein [Polaromonas sp.]NML85211.1 TolC family protein [Polaromonas sp.]